MKDFARFGMFSLGALVFATTTLAQNVDDATPFDHQIIAEPIGFPDDPSVAQVAREMGCYYDETGPSVYLPKTGEAVQLDETTGDETTGDETTGDEATGDEATGDEATGDETTGDETTGDEATGDEATGDEATGDETTGDEATGDEATGDEATGDEATGDEATGDETTGDEATGDEATGDEATGDEATGDEATGDEATGDEATGDEETGDEVTGDEATGDETTGDEATGDETTGDEARDEDGPDLNVASIYSNPPVYVICELWPDDTIMQISGGPHVQRGTIDSSWWRDFNAPLAAHDIKRSSQRNEPAQLPQVTPESFAEFCARPGLLQTLFCPISYTGVPPWGGPI